MPTLVQRQRRRLSALAWLALAALVLVPTVSRLLAPAAGGPGGTALCGTPDRPQPLHVSLLDACGHCALAHAGLAPAPALPTDLPLPPAMAEPVVVSAEAPAAADDRRLAQPRAPPATA
ncbi:MAG: hypothetical protein OEW22_05000 [Rubrivivax sp.]|nr:hypothetical protein [Rubrivivax sp.]